MSTSGVLAIWANCKPGHEALFEQWYQHEHLPERLAVPGFLRGKRYEALDESQRFLTCYYADSTAVFRSPGYLARLNDPTPLTRKIMSEAVTNLSRTICECESGGGSANGAYALSLALGSSAAEQEQTVSAAKACLNELFPGFSGLARYEVWLADSQSAADKSAPLSAEQALRGRDQTIAGCMFVETLRESDAHQIQLVLTEKLKIPLERARLYRLLCDVRADQ